MGRCMSPEQILHGQVWHYQVLPDEETTGEYDTIMVHYERIDGTELTTSYEETKRTIDTTITN